MSSPKNVFNKTIMQLVKSIELVFPENSNIERLKRAIRLDKSTDDTAVIKLAGPRILKYNDKIMERDESFFSDMNNIPELTNLPPEAKNEEEIIHNLFFLIKKFYFSQPKEHQDELYKKLITLLNSYMEFLIQDE